MILCFQKWFLPIKKAPKEFLIPLEPSERHLLEIPLHHPLPIDTFVEKYRKTISATFSISDLNSCCYLFLWKAFKIYGNFKGLSPSTTPFGKIKFY